MAKRLPLTDQDGEVRELAADELASAKPASALPASLRAKLGGRGPQRSPLKERVTIRLPAEVVDAFRATGDGWQTRMGAALETFMREHPQALKR